MALNTPITDSKEFIRASAQKRNLPKALVADFLCDQLIDKSRRQTFLNRNMTRALDVHRQRLTRSREQTTRSSKQSANFTNGVIFGQETPKANGTKATLINGINSHTDPNKAASDVDGDGEVSEHNTAIPAIQAMSHDTLLRKDQLENYDTGKRRSLRQKITKAYDEKDAVLVLNLCNLRKKLNWKTNKPSNDVRPRKRARLETQSCHAHLSIWDNSHGKEQQDPLINETEYCEIVTPKADIDPGVGKFLELKLEHQFVIPARKLRVPVKRNNETSLEFAEHYFLEIKLVPTKSDEKWPPIPLLGKSEGDQTRKLGSLAKEQLQESLVFRYQHLPQLPDTESPLSVFYLYEGSTFRTKYGVEMKAEWLREGDLPPRVVIKTESEPLLPPWAIDENDQPLGRKDPQREEAALTKQAAPKKQLAVKSTLPVVPPKAPDPSPEPVTKYKVDISRAQGEEKSFRIATIKGIACLACPRTKFTEIERLLLHLELRHHKYKYHLENTDTTGANISEYTIRIEVPESGRPRNGQRGRDPTKSDKEFAWAAPAEPLDVHRHVLEGDRSWLGAEYRPKVRRQNTSISFIPGSVMPDPLSAIRKANDGFLPFQHVQPSRPSQYTRKKHPNIRLLTIHKSQSVPYTSISHRPVLPEDSDEDARSETDDENDSTWFINRHLEHVDINARRYKWSDARRRLEKKWSHHVLYREGGEVHARYISDSLIRFVRIEKNWILQDTSEIISDQSSNVVTELEAKIAELMERGVINDTVCADVFTILYSDEAKLPAEEEKILLANFREERKAALAIKARNKFFRKCKLQDLPSDICGLCRKTINDSEMAVRCSNLNCETIGVYHHAKCAGFVVYSATATTAPVKQHGQFMQDRRDWKCERCRNDKGKKAVR